MRERDDLLREHEDLVRERDHLQRECDGLTEQRIQLTERAEDLQLAVDRYREQSERADRLFHYATGYAESVRESARREAELVLRKARAKAENERKVAERDLARLQALTSETRQRLSAFTTAALRILDTEVDTGRTASSEPAQGDVRDALQHQIAAVHRSEIEPVPEVERWDH